jgi:hypothetical protein
MLMRACLERRSPGEIAAMATQVQSAVQTQPDPEAMYFAATSLAVCGHADEAIELLRQSIRGNYCSYPSLTTDPSLTSLKVHPDFPGVVSAAKACREKFESFKRRHDATK